MRPRGLRAKNSTLFKVGEIIYYGTSGPCRVVSVGPRSVSGETEESLYYTLEPIYDKCTIHTPVENNKVRMRPIISKREAKRLIDRIPSIEAKPYNSKLTNNLIEYYKEQINSHDCDVLLELTLSIQAKKIEREEKKQTFGAIDKGFLQQAEELLCKELSVALEIPKEEVPDYIAARVKTERWS